MNIGAGIGIGFSEPRGGLAFEYEQSSVCQNGSDITPVINTPGGTFSSSPAGLSINSSTGVIDVSASTAGTYTVTYSIGPTEDTITIEAADDAAFTYSASSFPQDGSNPSPTVTGLAGGTFSAGTGLVFVDSGSNTESSTGQIDLSASTVASYTVTYTTNGSCPNTSIQTVGITAALAQVNNVYSMDFDGTNDSINIDGALTTLSSTTVGSWSCWVKPIDATPTNQNRIIQFGDTNGNGFLYIRIESDGKIGAQARNSGTSSWSFKSDSSIFSNNTWTHIAVVQDGVQPKVYKNGVEVPITFTVSTDKTAWFSDLPSLDNGRIGCGNQNNIGDIQFFNGAIDEVAVFNTALTANDVQRIYNATETGKTADLSQLTTPPIKWYRMGD